MKEKFEVVKNTPDPPENSSALLLEPWFRSRAEAIEIRRLQTLHERRKFAEFFARFGCIRCGTKTKPHNSSGFCASCYGWVTQGLRKVTHAHEPGRI